MKNMDKATGTEQLTELVHMLKRLGFGDEKHPGAIEGLNMTLGGMGEPWNGHGGLVGAVNELAHSIQEVADAIRERRSD